MGKRKWRCITLGMLVVIVTVGAVGVVMMQRDRDLGWVILVVAFVFAWLMQLVWFPFTAPD